MEQDSHKDIWDAMTTKTRMLMRYIQRRDGEMVAIERRMKEISVPQDRRGKDKGRGLWQALWHAMGVFKAEGDKVFKE